MRILHRSHGKYELFDQVGASHALDMDLYISPLSCSFAAHVACLEAGVPFTLHRVDRKTKRLDDGRDYRAVAPQAIVPAVSLDDGAILTESAAVLQYIADRVPEKELAPRWGTAERYRLVEWLNFITTELHKKHLWMIFSTRTPEPVKSWAKSSAASALSHVAARLDAHDFLLGDRFTVADAYLFWALLVAPHGGLSIDAYPSLVAYCDRIRARPSVKAALAHEYPLYMKEAAVNGDLAQPSATAARA
jgi:glutathione S-transferase